METKTNILNYQTFEVGLKKELSKLIGTGYCVEAVNIQRINLRPEPAIVLKETGVEQSLSPAFYLDKLYCDYNKGESMTSLAADIIRKYKQTETTNYDARSYYNFENIKSNIVCRVCNYDRNRDLLKQVPHRKVLTLAVVYYVQASRTKSILVRNSHIIVWNIDEENLFSIATANTRRLFPCRTVSLCECLEDILDCPLDEVQQKNVPVKIRVLTNDQLMFGSVNILFDDILSAACRQLGCTRIYILPSSVHELLLLSADDFTDRDPNCLSAIVREINEKFVEEADILDDTVFLYSLLDQKLITVA